MDYYISPQELRTLYVRRLAPLSRNIHDFLLATNLSRGLDTEHIIIICKFFDILAKALFENVF